MEQLTLLPDPPRASHPGIVYFMTDGYLIKIGYSSRPVKYRSVEVRATVLAFQPGSRTEERQLHQIFKRWCVGSEWFRVPDEPTALTELRLLVQEWGGQHGLTILDRVIAANLRRVAIAAA
jgi:hypothetical protein